MSLSFSQLLWQTTELPGNQSQINTVDNGITAVEVFAWDHFDWYTKLGGACDIAMTFQMRNTSRETLLQFKAIDIKAST